MVAWFFTVFFLTTYVDEFFLSLILESRTHFKPGEGYQNGVRSCPERPETWKLKKVHVKIK